MFVETKRMKTTDTIGLAKTKDVTDRRVRKVLSDLTMLLTTPSTSEAAERHKRKKIQRRLDWLGDNYVSHQKIGGNYIITVKQ